MKWFDPDNLNGTSRWRHALRLFIPFAFGLGWLFGSTAAIPEYDTFASHSEPVYQGIGAGVLLGYLVCAFWPRGKWSPELLTIVAVVMTSLLLAVGILEHEYVGHIHRYTGIAALPITYVAMVLSTFVTLPASISEAPRKLVVPVFAALLAIAAFAEYQVLKPSSPADIAADIAIK